MGLLSEAQVKPAREGSLEGRSRNADEISASMQTKYGVVDKKRIYGFAGDYTVGNINFAPMGLMENCAIKVRPPTQQDNILTLSLHRCKATPHPTPT